MKKLCKFILIALLSFSCILAVNGESDHVIIEEPTDFMSSQQYEDLNEDLQQIKENYDIDIYFIYDTRIDNTETGVKKYAEDFLKNNASATNNVAIVMSSNVYYVAADGPASSEVVKNEEAIFNKFYSRASSVSASDPNAFYEGIKDCYQYVVKFVNEVSYESEAPVSTLKALVNDYADLLSDNEEEKLNRKLQKIKDKYGFDAVVVTTDSFNGMSARDYADDLYDYSQYGQDGILFLLNMSERSWYVSTKGKAIDYFTEYGIDEIFDDMADDLSAGKYYDAFVIYADRVDKYILNGEKGDIIDIDNTKPKATFGVVNVMISAIFGAISSLITSLSLKGKMANTRRQTSARNYIVNNSFYVNGASDMLVNRHVTRTMRPRNNPSNHTQGPSSHMGGGFSGGSHTHTSSSGSSHGGHGGHF